MADLFTLSSSALPDDTTLIDFRLTEAVNEPFELVVHFTTRSPDDIDFADAIGLKATVKADRGSGGPQMQWGGVFAAIDHIHQTDAVGVFRGLIVPAAWQLAFGEHSRVFTKKNAKEFVTDVLSAAGLIDGSDFEFRLNGSPATEEFVCQYRESDLAFVTRWLEREGYHYFFEHGDDGSKMVITDKKASESLASGAIRYFPSIGHDGSSGEAFQRFRATRRAALATIKLRDYDYKNPSLDVKGEASASSSGTTEFSRFGDRFFTPSDGDRLAKVRAESALAREEIYLGSGTPFGLRTGYVFELEQHPRGALNKKYFATRLRHHGVQSSGATSDIAKLLGIDTKDVYRVEVEEATDAELQYRPPRVTKWPRISGQEVATIDGEGNDDYAQLDDDGRYLVKFMFDENSHDAGKASTRIRMMQPHAGNPEGFHFPLRKGTEVVIIFLSGDPDRPIITGAIPNALTPSPITSKNHTRNKIITGAENIIEIEDEKGKEWIDVYTPAKKTDLHMGTAKDWKDVGKSPKTVQANYGEHTDGTAARSVGGDQYIDIGGILEEHVKGNVQEDYDAEVNQIYAGPKSQTVNNDVTELFDGDQKTTITGDRIIKVAGDRKEDVGGDIIETVGGDHKETVGGDMIFKVGGDAKRTIGADAADTIGSNASQTVGGNWTQTVGGSGTIMVGGAMTTMFPSSWTNLSGPTTWLTGNTIWVTPKCDVICPAWTFVLADWFQTGGKTGTAYGLNISLAGLSVQGAIVSITATGAKLETWGFQGTLKGAFIENEGFDLKGGGPKIEIMAIIILI
ncbi:MAG: type VI secretion system tip protein TssI/VgrG [Polyangiaceae bacterium]